MNVEKTPLTDEDKKERDARRRERERKHRDAKDKKPSRKLDIIDQLDATSIYGTGREYHRLATNPRMRLIARFQCSTMTVLSMPSTRTEIAQAAVALPCRPSPKTLSTTSWEAPVL